MIRAGAGLWLAACGSAQPPATPEPPGDVACIVRDDGARGLITIGVPGSLEAGPPPLALRQVFQTVTAIDCAGNIVPRLAESWTADAQARVWQFRIRTDARFADGSAVTARDVAQSWAGTTTLPIIDITVLDERTLRVTLGTPVGTAARFADPALAVVRHSSNRPALGTGVYRIDRQDAQGMRLIAEQSAPHVPDTLVFRVFPGGDARVALDAGVDVLVTADPAVIDYARALRAYTVTPMSWSRTYVLATAGTPADSVMVLPDTAATSIREALRLETRGVEHWPDTGCSWATSPSATSGVRSRRILYPARDALARGIAERLVALSWPPSRAPQWLIRELGSGYAAQGAPVAAGVDEQTLYDAVRSGNALALVTVARHAYECEAWRGMRVLPLLQARDYLVHRDSVGRIVEDGDGRIRFVGGRP